MIQIDLSGKTALVTGGGQGLGAATCQLLSDAGAKVIVNYFNDSAGVNKELAEATAAKLTAGSVALEADVGNSSQVQQMFEKAAEQFGTIDIIVNNAAILRDRTVKKMSEGEWDSVIETNLKGAFNICRTAVAGGLISDGGRIVNMSSISGTVGFFGQANYAAAKAGVIALTKVLSKELAFKNITVNAVAPGVILTEMGKTIPEKVRAEMLKLIPLGRFGEPDEIAGVILFLCSDLASYITGQVIHTNGGWI